MSAAAFFVYVIPALLTVSLALIIVMLVSLAKQGDERRQAILSKACVSHVLYYAWHPHCRRDPQRHPRLYRRMGRQRNPFVRAARPHRSSVRRRARGLSAQIWRLSSMNNRIRILRTEKGISQEELARRCGVTRQTVNAIENNKYDPTLSLAFRLADELGTTVDALFLRV